LSFILFVKRLQWLLEKGITMHDDFHDLGLQGDLAMWERSPVKRRQVVKLGLVGIATLLTSCSRSQTDSDGCLTEIPEETAGPFPGNGSNGQNALTRSGIVRGDVRASLATGTVAEGVPLSVQLQLVNVSAGCAPLEGYALYLWHCDREGRYSMYSNGVTSEDYLRGVQESDAEGKVTFQSIFPGCYQGRWPHIHFEIYPSVAQATNANNKLHTSQLAFPEDVCEAVYASSGYEQSVSNLSGLSLSTDGVFRDDGAEKQLATMTGDLTSGYLATLVVGVAV
jgi:protocatechuate 3,4-dioxygenase beta subunit